MSLANAICIFAVLAYALFFIAACCPARPVSRDARCLWRQRLRGVAVIPLGLPERELAALQAAQVVGLRINVHYGGGVDYARLEDYGALARDMGWHLQFLVGAGDLLDLLADWVPDEAERNAVLTENAWKLYGFPAEG